MIAEPIEGKFVRLVTADKKDAQFTSDIRRDARNTKYMPKLDVGLKQQEEWLQRQRESDNSVFFLVERRNGEPIGTFSLYNIEGKRGETGRMIIRGNQLETLETVLLFHDYVFFNVDLNEVYSEIDEDNLPAQGVAKSAGAVNRGYVDDREKKLLMYVAMKDDYIKAREKLAKLVERFAARLGE